ncbi:2',3'-cyclic-nucleotide 3'-phosphodiesterase-like [Ornithodoros turicata]|uniref:2',3'-cyclic-nucleotide 3'-phosphodiesterase-like n=1 Tax=Ornithodoros turicata TaxID=34597 RepID=UPI0031389675
MSIRSQDRPKKKTNVFRKSEQNPVSMDAQRYLLEDKDYDEVFDFPYLKDETVKRFLNSHGRLFFLVRGLPGSGKGPLGDLLKKHYPQSELYWADSMFLGPNAPVRTKVTLGKSHDVCRRKMEDYMIKNVPVIINRNSNICVWEIVPYLRLAARYGYTVILAETSHKIRAKAEVLAQTNSRQLNAGYMRMRGGQWEEVYPMYTGWFLRPVDGLFLFRRLGRISRLLTESGWKQAEMSHTEGQPFCLGRSCWFAQAPEDKTYCDSKEVKDAYGTVHTLSIIGYAIMSGLAVALVALDKTQTRLLGRPKAADDDFLSMRMTALNIQDWEPTPCVKKLSDIVLDEDNPQPLMLAKTTTVPESVSFVILGAYGKLDRPLFLKFKEIRNHWDTFRKKMLISSDGVSCKDKMKLGDVDAYRDGKEILLLDRSVQLDSVFTGYYQPYTVPRMQPWHTSRPSWR